MINEYDGDMFRRMKEDTKFVHYLNKLVNDKLKQFCINANKIQIEEILNSRDTLLLTINHCLQENIIDKTNLFILRKQQDGEYSFLKSNFPLLDNSSGSFEYSKLPLCIDIHDSVLIERFCLSSSLSTMIIVYRDKENNIKLQIIKSNFPCFLGTCYSINRCLNIDKNFICKGIKIKSSDENSVEFNFHMEHPYEDNLILDVVINKNRNNYDLEIIYNSHDR